MRDVLLRRAVKAEAYAEEAPGNVLRMPLKQRSSKVGRQKVRVRKMRKGMTRRRKGGTRSHLCNGKCQSTRATVRTGTRGYLRYGSGMKYCRICRVPIGASWHGIKCPCCIHLLRTGPRRKKRHMMRRIGRRATFSAAVAAIWRRMRLRCEFLLAPGIGSKHEMRRARRTEQEK